MFPNYISNTRENRISPVTQDKRKEEFRCFLASTSGTGTVGDEESEESSDSQAF